MTETKNSKQSINRIPKKPLNKFIKSALLTLLKRDDIKIIDHVSAGSNTITVTDSQGKYLFSYENGWDFGYYYISMANPENNEKPIKVAEMDWYENDGNTNPQQQDIFDIFNALNNKRTELQAIEQARKNLTKDEIQALKALGIER
ncbi:MAG: hypothetical protein ACLRFI_03670 [Alphaproteobacteria bacterium]